MQIAIERVEIELLSVKFPAVPRAAVTTLYIGVCATASERWASERVSTGWRHKIHPLHQPDFFMQQRAALSKVKSWKAQRECVF